MRKLLFFSMALLCLLCSRMALAQEQYGTVKGLVRSETGEGIPGVSVTAVDKKTNFRSGTMTDSAGVFTFNRLPSGSNYRFIFSSVGYTQQVLEGYNIRPNAVTSIVTKMNTALSDLNEVVVIGYGTRRKADVTGSIASVSAEQVRQVPVTNVSQALQGRVPGLVASASSFRPGSSSTIRIRGSRSLRANNNPLYVVDGIPMASENTIDDINPLDIESIDVLKDASATAIYGSRGANGVIQITTKKGRAGKISVEYSGTTSFDKILKPLEVFNGPEWAQL